MGEAGDPGRILSTWFGAIVVEIEKYDRLKNIPLGGSITELSNLLCVRDKKERRMQAEFQGVGFGNYWLCHY